MFKKNGLQIFHKKKDMESVFFNAHIYTNYKKMNSTLKVENLNFPGCHFFEIIM